MPAVVEHHPAFSEHEAGWGHPERPERMDAVVSGIRAADLGDAVSWVEPRPATLDEVALVHDRGYLDALRRFCEEGGGWITQDTAAGPESWRAALLAAGAALDAIDRGAGAFCAVRPPGHHATSRRASGFCLLNNIAICASWLAGRGERVLIVDWDVHHGDGTQDTFYEDDRVLYVSFHQSPLYPFTGSLDETGTGPGDGYTVNFPFPAGATGDVYQAGMDVVASAAASFDPAWVLVSSGFDSHRDDDLPDTGLGLTSGDYAAMTRRCLDLAPAPERCLLLLEGGYNLDALAHSAAACVAVLAGAGHTPAEEPTTGGPGIDVVETVARRIPG